MSAEDISIRAATPGDAAALLSIYAPYVENTAVTFEYAVPSEAEFAVRIQNTLARYPYLLAVQSGTVIGYAYAGAMSGRPAYDRSAEVTVYVRANARRLGAGRALYEALEAALKEQGVLNLYACIAYPVQPDAYLSLDSPAFHARMGYAEVGRFHGCGYKFSHWYDVIWMEKRIGAHTAAPRPVKTFDEILPRLTF